MKCRKCNLAERHGSLAYCSDCNAEYMKEYREKKKAKMDQPVKKSPYEKVCKEMNEIASTLGPGVCVKTDGTTTIIPKSEPIHPALKNPLYLSYYVRPGTELHKELIEAEKVYEVEGRI